MTTLTFKAIKDEDTRIVIHPYFALDFKPSAGDVIRLFDINTCELRCYEVVKIYYNFVNTRDAEIKTRIHELHLKEIFSLDVNYSP